MVFSVALVSFTMGVLLGPPLTRRIKRANCLSGLSGGAALALLAASLSPSFAGFLVAYSVAFGFLSGALYNFALSQAAESSRPNLLLPFSVAAFGLGGAIFGPVSLWLTENGMGLWSMAPAMACLAIVCAISMLGGALEEAEPIAAISATGFVRPDANTVLLWAIFAAGSFPGLIILGFASQIMPQAGSGLVLAGFAVFLAAVGNTLGRLAASPVAGLVGSSRGVFLSFILTLSALAGLLLARGSGASVAWLFLAAFAYGHLAANMPLYVRANVGPEAFPGVFGWVFTGWGFAGFVGPWVAGGLLDLTGRFTFSLMVSAGVASIGLVLIAWHMRAMPLRSDINRSKAAKN